MHLMGLSTAPTKTPPSITRLVSITYSHLVAGQRALTLLDWTTYGREMRATERGLHGLRLATRIPSAASRPWASTRKRWRSSLARMGVDPAAAGFARGTRVRRARARGRENGGSILGGEEILEEALSMVVGPPSCHVNRRLRGWR
jgi:hypothetical protein